MIFKIAWRNIWRSKLRSFTVMGSVIIGVWSLSFMLAFFAGFIEAYVSSAIENDLSHIQLHHPDFKKDKEAHVLVSTTEKLYHVVNDVVAIALKSELMEKVGGNLKLLTLVNTN